MSTTIYEQIRLLHVYYEVSVAILSYILTVFVIYLAIYKSNKTMKQYSLIIILSSVVELFYTTATLVSMPVAEMVNGKLFMINTGPFEQVKQPYSVFIFSFWLFGMYSLLVNTTMIFVYRYKVLCGRQSSLNMTKFAQVYVFLMFYTGIQSALCYVTVESPNEDHWKIISENGVFAVNPPTLNVYDATKLIPFLHILHANLICTCLYSTIIYSGYKVHKCLVLSRQYMSRNTVSVQTQLTKIMLLQAAYPLFLILLPVVLFCLGPIFRITIPFIGIFLGSTISSIPIVNSITTICIVPSFRRALLQKVLGKRYQAKVSHQSGSFTNQAFSIEPNQQRRLSSFVDNTQRNGYI